MFQVPTWFIFVCKKDELTDFSVPLDGAKCSSSGKINRANVRLSTDLTGKKCEKYTKYIAISSYYDLKQQ